MKSIRVAGAILITGLLVLPLAAVPQEVPSPAIRLTTHYVLVDVTVTDKEGKPVTDLKPQDVVVKENGKVQKVGSFNLERSAASFSPPVMPADVYSNRPEYRMPSGALTILLIDGLNTSIQNQAYARQQLIRYVSTQFTPGQPMAVYALTNRLIRLQDFTTDPVLLRIALEQYRVPIVARSAGDNPAAAAPSTAIATGAATMHAGPLTAATSAMANLVAFEQEQTATALQTRIATTLEALRTLARITGGHRGRKNLIWVSAGFPFALSPEEGATTTTSMAVRMLDPTGPPPLANEGNIGNVASAVQQSFLDEIHRTAWLLSEVQTAVYPVDARGLIGSTLSDASKTGLNESGLLMMGADYGQHVSSATGSIIDSLQNMKELARQTGGRAFVSRNDIDRAVALAVQDGGTYYNIGYVSQNKNFDGSFRNIKVEVSRPGLQVRHRMGYFAIDPVKRKKQQDTDTTAMVRNIGVDATMVYFDALVSAPQKPGAKAIVPIRFRVEPTSISWDDGSNNKHRVNIELFAVAISADGRIASNTGKTIDTELEPSQYEQVLKQGLLVPLDVELPPGKYQMRLAVRDNRTGVLGTLTAPLTIGP